MLENRDTKDGNIEKLVGAGDNTDEDNEGDDTVDGENEVTFLFPSIKDTCNGLETGDNTVIV